jgi:hypothetical protein
VITTDLLPTANVGLPYLLQLGANGGIPPYEWSLVRGSANPPPGISLNPDGVLSGVPTTNGVYNFQLQVTDIVSNLMKKTLEISVNPRPTLVEPTLFANRFQMVLAVGGGNQNYTVEVSTNLETWTSLFVTNSVATNAFLITDTNATSRSRFYRVLIGP